MLTPEANIIEASTSGVAVPFPLYWLHNLATPNKRLIHDQSTIYVILYMNTIAHLLKCLFQQMLVDYI